MSRYPFEPEKMIDGGLPESDRVDTSSMSHEELDAWLKSLDDGEPQQIPFSNFALCTDEGRRDFLEEYIFWGAERLFEAVGYIWDSLNEPKDARCIGIGIAAKTGGTGKAALAKFLHKALRSALDYEVPMPSPKGEGLEKFQQDVASYFAADRDHYENAIQVYADILGGEPGRHQPPADNLIQGPWHSARKNRSPGADFTNRALEL